MSGYEIFLTAAVGFVLAIDVWHNLRIMRAYAHMANETQTKAVMSADSRRHFASFFPLCGYGTHGMHIVHVGSEVIIALVLLAAGTEFVDSLLVPLLFVLTGSAVMHRQQAKAAEGALDSFFRDDLDVLEKAIEKGLFDLNGK